MNKTLLPSIQTLVAAVVFCLPISAIHAGPGWFLGGGGALVSFDDGIDEINPTNAFIRGGVALNQYIDLGVEFSFTLIPDELSGVDFDVDTTFFYLKGNLPVGERAKLYVLFGSSDVELTASVGNASLTADDHDTGIGAGIEYQLRDSLFFTADYINYFDDAGVTSDAVNVGVVKRY